MVQLLLGQQRQLGQSLVGATRGGASPASNERNFAFPRHVSRSDLSMCASNRTANTRENDIHRAYPSVIDRGSLLIPARLIRRDSGIPIGEAN